MRINFDSLLLPHRRVTQGCLQMFYNDCPSIAEKVSDFSLHANHKMQLIVNWFQVVHKILLHARKSLQTSPFSHMYPNTYLVWLFLFLQMTHLSLQNNCTPIYLAKSAGSLLTPPLVTHPSSYQLLPSSCKPILLCYEYGNSGLIFHYTS